MSNFQELILDILEKQDNKLDRVIEDVNDIKVQQGRHDEVVYRHEARSTELTELVNVIRKDTDARIKVLEKDAQFFRNFIMIMTGLGAVVGFVFKVAPLLGLLQ